MNSGSDTEAGIVKPPDPLKQLLRWWDLASPEQQAAFLGHINTL